MAWKGFDEKWLAERERRVAARVGGNVEVVRKLDRAVVQSASDAGLYALVGMCRAAGWMEPVPEWRFHVERRWRFDYAWPLPKLALEVEGGLFTQGRHTRGVGAVKDLEKYSEAAILGWRILYATPDEVRNGVALDRIGRALNGGSHDEGQA